MGNKTLTEAAYTIHAYDGYALPNQYVNFVVSRWLRSYRFGNDYIKLSDSDNYFQTYNLYIHRILYSPITVVRIAALADDPDTALGFSVCRGSVLDYVHVHKDCRKLGIASFLVPDGIEAFTHLTRIGMKLWPTKLPKAIFKPFT